MKRRSSTLDRSFGPLWCGQSLSEIGTQISFLLIPTLAITHLAAGPRAIGVLNAITFIAFPMFALSAGAWADSRDKRTIMIVTDVLRALCLAVIPLASAAGVLAIWQVLAVAGVGGVLTVYFEAAYQAWMPQLTTRLDAANAWLSGGRSFAAVVGPAVAGVTAQRIGIANAIVVDALSYALSVALTLSIPRRAHLRQDDSTADAPPPQVASGTADDDVPEQDGRARAGLLYIRSRPDLLRIAALGACCNFGLQVVQVNYLVFAYRSLHLSAASVGVIFGISGAASLLGSAFALRLLRRSTLRSVLAATMIVAACAQGLLALATPSSAFVVLAMAGVGIALCLPLYDIAQLSYRQRTTPDYLQGRVNAGMRAIVWSSIPVGALVGGFLGQVSSRGTIVLGSALMLLGVITVLGLRDVGSPASEVADSVRDARPVNV